MPENFGTLLDQSWSLKILFLWIASARANQPVSIWSQPVPAFFCDTFWACISGFDSRMKQTFESSERFHGSSVAEPLRRMLKSVTSSRLFIPIHSALGYILPGYLETQSDFLWLYFFLWAICWLSAFGFTLLGLMLPFSVSLFLRQSSYHSEELSFRGLTMRLTGPSFASLLSLG